jgi:hypothetical protein
MNAGILMGSKGNWGPTWGFLILKVSKRTIKELTLMIIPTVGVHCGVGGTVAWTANSIDEIKRLSPREIICKQQKL